MTTTPRILAFAGSARRESFNRRLLAVAAEAAQSAGGAVTVIGLGDYEMPLYHGDWEEEHGLPEAAVRLSGQIRGHDALLVASPEYNAMITPLLKNTIDWCTRGDDNPFEGKVAAVISASPGAFGAIRSAAMVRQLLHKLGCYLTPAQVALPKAGEAFDEQGKLKNAHVLEALKHMATELVETTRKLK